MKKKSIFNHYWTLLEVISFATFKEKKRLIQVIILGIIGGAFELASVAIILPLLTSFLGSDNQNLPRFINFFIDSIGGEDVENLPIKITIIFSLTALSGAIIRAYYLYLSGKISAQIGVSISDKAYSCSLSKPYSFYLKNGTTKLVSTFTIKPGQVSVSINNILLIISSAFLLLSILIILLIINLKISLITFISLFMAYWFLNIFISNKLKTNSYLMCRDNDLALKSVQQSFDAIRDIIIDRSQDFFRYDFRKLSNSVRTKYAENSFYGSAPKILIEPIAIITIISTIIADVSLNNSSFANALPIFGSITFGLQKMLPLMQIIYANYTSLRSNIEFVKDVVSLIEFDKISNKNINKKPFPFKAEIVFDDIHFKYSRDRKYVLKNLNFKIKKGEKIGLVGASGSGKSTFLDLFIGLIKPTKGRIFVDDLSVSEISKTGNKYILQNNISHVPQDVVLHDVSIAENIALGDTKKQIDLEHLKKCLEIVQLDSFVESLSSNIWTNCGEKGISLSGGQCQRIGIARALYKKKEILILDEATNRLDLQTESNLLNSIFKNSTQTIITVSHRTSSLKKCDKIYKIFDKKIVLLPPN